MSGASRAARESKYLTFDSVKILRVKTTYEQMVREKVKHPIFFNVSAESATTRATAARFLLIYERCVRLGVDVHDYLTVLFAYPPPFVAKWPYPYLSYIASDKAEEIYLEKRDFIKRVFNGALDETVKAVSPLNVESRFTNCFYNGFPVILSAADSVGFEQLRREDFLFATFYAFSEVFTPEYLVSHPRFHIYRQMRLEGEDAGVQVALLNYVKVEEKRAATDHKYKAALEAARENVRRKEWLSVRRYWFDVGDNLPVAYRGEVWNLM